MDTKPAGKLNKRVAVTKAALHRKLGTELDTWRQHYSLFQ